MENAKIVWTNKVDGDSRCTYANSLFRVSLWFCIVAKRLPLFLTNLFCYVMMTTADNQGTQSIYDRGESYLLLLLVLGFTGPCCFISLFNCWTILNI